MIIVVESFLEPVRSLNMDSWSDLYYWACISFCEPGLKSKQKAVGYPHNSYATITVNHKVHNWVRKLMTASPSSLQTSFDTMKLVSRNFPVSFNLISLLPVTSVCGVFSNRILTSRSGQ